MLFHLRSIQRFRSNRCVLKIGKKIARSIRSWQDLSLWMQLRSTKLRSRRWKQKQYEPLAVEKQVAVIFAGTNGFLDDVPLAQVRAFETGLYQFLDSRHAQVLAGIREKKQLDDEIKAALNAAVKDFATEFAARKSAAA